MALATTPGFDASVLEFGLSLLHGLVIVPVSQALRDDPWALKRFYRDHGVTVAFHAPSILAREPGHSPSRGCASS